MQRQLATIQKITELHEIPGADNIQLAKVLGWSLIVKRGEFTPGTLCVFFELDSVLPVADWSAFMESKKYRVKTMKLTKFGVVSQGLALPVNISPLLEEAGEGDDVTELLGVIKHVVEDDIKLNGTRGPQGLPFPSGVPQTDETRLQSIPWVLEQMALEEFYISQKMDGCSATYFIDPSTHEFRAASRNCELKRDDSIWWRVAEELNIENVMRTQPEGIVIQGEIVGPGIRKNRLGLSEHRFYVFNAYKIKTGTYLDLFDLSNYCVSTGLTTVPMLEVGLAFSYTQEDLEKIADEGVYDNGYPQEGIVVRPISVKLHPILGMLSFKVLNKEFLLKTDQ